MNEPHPERETEGTGYEPRDVDPGGVGLVGAMLVFGLMLVSIGCAFFYQTTAHRTERAEGPLTVPVPETRASFPPPELENHTGEVLAGFRAAEEKVLGSYGWVDSRRGIVRIPVERAMQLAVRRGFPVRGSQPPDAPTWEEMLHRRGEEGSAAVEAERRRP
ncbi:MAG TPA: hypothetical protein VNQ90_19015 [Chthoniobacteraceae bacterium]|nr:hypothetical protein [Chthoniobacteraceae bacterium]